MYYLKNTVLLFAAISLVAISCNSPNEDASQVVDDIAQQGDTISPPADEAKGMDNTKGYRTVQMSTDYDKMIPLPEEMIEETQRFPVYLPDQSSLDLSPDRYYYRYLLPDTGEKTVGLEGMVQQPPLFAASCLKAPQPLDCSNEQLRAYLKQQATPDGKGTLVYAYITIDEKGKMERLDRLEVAEGEPPCADCTKKAREVLYKMPEWQPASLDGSPVKSQAVLPIYVNG